MTSKRLMVIVAHPDDESFPIGGTIAKTVAEGGEVMLVTATRGEAGISGLSSEETGRLREQELRAACDVLGVQTLLFLDYRDGAFDRVDAHAAIDQLITLMRAFRPDVIITFGPDGISGHPDHLAVHRWTTAAFEQARRAGWAWRLYYITPSEGDLEEATSHLVCHEVFTRVWPMTGPDADETLFEPAAPHRPHFAPVAMLAAAR